MAVRTKIGLLEIGQSQNIPDQDFLALKDEMDFVTIAPLDAYNDQELAAQFQPLLGELPISSCTRTGQRVLVSSSALVPELQKGVQEGVNIGCAALLLTCTGQFDLGNTTIPVIMPGDLLRDRVQQYQSQIERTAVLVPVDEQQELLRHRWRLRLPSTIQIHSFTLSPQSSLLECHNMGQHLLQLGVDTVIMDCLGYSLAQKKAIYEVIPRVFNAKEAAMEFIQSSLRRVAV
ncbi:hypothetical protein LTR84_011784 [Exophiala bonariae]|uniref:AroM protein n=1 Tax=Exophiala bonariae TaxID=1690606 RepID=A0AAV9NJG3_9EURO|nr:hypothetical protein LTR84_011784 [Exophiala bonariae]